MGALAQQGPGTEFYSWVLVHLLVEGAQSVQDYKKIQRVLDVCFEQLNMGDNKTLIQSDALVVLGWVSNL